MEEYENFDAMHERARKLVERWDEEKENAESHDPEAESKGTTESTRVAKADEARKGETGPEERHLPAR
jgi:hypothetical protein